MNINGKDLSAREILELALGKSQLTALEVRKPEEEKIKVKILENSSCNDREKR